MFCKAGDKHVGTVCPQAWQHSSNIAGKQICENIPLQEVSLKIPLHCIVLQEVSKFEVFNLTRLNMERKRAATTVVVALLLDEYVNKLKRKRGITRKWIKTREAKGFYANLVHKLLIEDTVTYKEMRMSHDSFKTLHKSERNVFR